jgi:hypothetical protein
MIESGQRLPTNTFIGSLAGRFVLETYLMAPASTH